MSSPDTSSERPGDELPDNTPTVAAEPVTAIDIALRAELRELLGF